MDATNRPVMSDNIEAAEWIRGRLSPREEHAVTSIIPTGFEAYARVLHPAQAPDERHDLVRWSDVSRWSDVAINDHVQWHEIALPRVAPSTAPPWQGQGPRAGSPFAGDVDALVEHLSNATSTPESCFFCFWSGYLGGGARFVSSGPSEQLPPPPQPSRLVKLPWRDYALFEGPLSGATSFKEVSHWPGSTAHLWWPSDHAWCVASEIDLPWTYVGGTTELIGRVLADQRLEALPATPDDLIILRLDGWLADLIERATDDVLSKGSAHLTLTLGTAEVTWRKSGVFAHRSLSSTTTGINGESSGHSPVRTHDREHLRRQIHSEVRRAVLSLISA
jgi:hypothetical protein